MKKSLLPALGCVALMGCWAESDPCAVAIRLLVRADAARVHGLTQNDDFKEAQGRLQKAEACAKGDQAPVVAWHRQLFEDRLAATGVTLDPVDPVAHHLAERLQTYAEGILQESVLKPELRARAQLINQVYNPGVVTSDHEVTRAVVLLAHRVESCVQVTLGKNVAGPGMVQLSVLRGTQALPLHGEPAIMRAEAGKTARVCVSQAFQEEDLLRLSSEGKTLWTTRLLALPEDWARGAALAALRGDPAPEACAQVASVEARMACGWAGGAP